MAQENRDAPRPDPPQREEGAATGQQQSQTTHSVSFTVTVNNSPSARRTGSRRRS